MDRRLFLLSGGLGLTSYVTGLAAEPSTTLSPAGSLTPPSKPAAPINHAAWINFEYPITWERVNVLQDMVTGLVGRGLTDITLMISSAGGDIAAALSTYGFLKSAGINLTTYNIGNTYSAAMMIFLAADRRVAGPQSQFLLHPASLTSLLPQSISDLRNREESLERDNARLRDVLVASTHMSKEEADPLVGKMTFLDPADALRIGIATEVGHLVKPTPAQLLTLPISTFHGPATPDARGDSEPSAVDHLKRQVEHPRGDKLTALDGSDGDDDA